MEKVSLFPLELPRHPCQNFLFRSMRLCRSAPDSHPAPVPRCRGGAARWKGVRPCRVPYPCRRVHRVPVRQRKALSGRLRATDSERARGGGSGTRARASLSGFLGMTGSRPAQRTVWTNPALWSATNQGNFFFSGQGPVGGAGILHGRRAVRAYFRTAARTRWAGLESGEKRSWRGKRPGCNGWAVWIRRQAGMPHRAVAQKAFVFPDLRRNTMPEEGTSGRVRITNAPQRLGMSRADGSLHACNNSGPCRRLQKNLS